MVRMRVCLARRRTGGVVGAVTETLSLFPVIVRREPAFAYRLGLGSFVELRADPVVSGKASQDFSHEITRISSLKARL